MSEAGRESSEILTIGHSAHSYEAFLALLRGAGVTAVADVRSSPYSSQNPQFNRETLREDLVADGLAYVFLGEALGGRPKDRRFFAEGVADYERMAREPSFAQGIARVLDGARRYRVALMCSEQDPLECHRCLLVGRALKERGVPVGHILAGGEVESQAAVEATLLDMAGEDLDQADFLAGPQERIASAYRRRARRVAFAASDATAADGVAAE